MEQNRYYSYNSYLRNTFGTRVHKLSLDAGFSCPNLDGRLSSQGCNFCSNKAFSYHLRNQEKSLKQQIEKSISFARTRYKAKKFIAYFQTFTNTYADLEILQKKYSTIKEFPDIVGISVSTRPDCINRKQLDLLSDFSQKYRVYIEYGLQTIHNRSLTKLNRNHDFKAFETALKLTSNYKDIYPAAHIILGLPGETIPEMISTAKTLAKMPLWGVKIHCLHVVKNTYLLQEYQKGFLKLLDPEKYINLLSEFIRYLPKNMVILRLISEANPQELIAPLWLNQKSKILNKFNKLLEEKNICQGDYT